MRHSHIRSSRRDHCSLAVLTGIPVPSWTSRIPGRTKPLWQERRRIHGAEEEEKLATRPPATPKPATTPAVLVDATDTPNHGFQTDLVAHRHPYAAPLRAVGPRGRASRNPSLMRPHTWIRFSGARGTSSLPSTASFVLSFHLIEQRYPLSRWPSVHNDPLRPV